MPALHRRRITLAQRMLRNRALQNPGRARHHSAIEQPSIADLYKAFLEDGIAEIWIIIQRELGYGDQIVTQLKRALVGMGACLLIAGCQTKGIYSAVADAHIVDVSVQSNAKSLPPSVVPKIREGLRTRLSVYPKSGRAKCMTVVINDYHLKNAALSLLVGDSNRMNGTVQTVDATSGARDGNKPVVALDSYMMNGVIGAAQAATQDKAKVENALADAFEMKVLHALYGSAHTVEQTDVVSPPRVSSNDAASANAAKPASATAQAPTTPRCGGAPNQV